MSKSTAELAVDKHKIGECMVVGCSGPVLYRNANTVLFNKTVRGYCGKHKALAVSKANTSVCEWMADRYGD